MLLPFITGALKMPVVSGSDNVQSILAALNIKEVWAGGVLRFGQEVVPPGSITSLEYAGFTQNQVASPLAMPAGVTVGSLLVFIDRVNPGSVPVEAYPAGFAPLSTFLASSTAGLCTSYKVVTQTDIDTNMTMHGMTATAGYNHICALFQGKNAGLTNEPITAVENVVIAGQMIAAAPGNRDIQISANGYANSASIALCVYASTGAVTPGWTSPDTPLQATPSTSSGVMNLGLAQCSSASTLVTTSLADFGNNNTLQPLLLKVN